MSNAEPLLDASWIITTHSPYILSAFNDLIEAGRLGADSGLKTEVNEIIPEQYWTKPGDFKAYSIHDGKLESHHGRGDWPDQWAIPLLEKRNIEQDWRGL